MLWLILLPILMMINYVVMYKKEKEPISFIDLIAAGTLGLLIGASIMALCSIPANLFADTTYETVDSFEISALNDNVSTHGKFFLGTGSMKEEMRYYFIEDTESGKHINSIPAKNAYIHESNSETPRMEKQKSVWVSDWINWFCIKPDDIQYHIYIPENSVTTDFNIDLSP